MPPKKGKDDKELPKGLVIDGAGARFYNPLFAERERLEKAAAVASAADGKDRVVGRDGDVVVALQRLPDISGGPNQPPHYQVLAGKVEDPEELIAAAEDAANQHPGQNPQAPQGAAPASQRDKQQNPRK